MRLLLMFSAALLALTTAAKAEFVLDSFDDPAVPTPGLLTNPTTVTGTGPNGSFEAERTTTFALIGGGSGIATSSPAEIDYVFSSDFNPGANFITFDGVSSTNFSNALLTAQFISGSISSEVSIGIPGGGSDTLFLDITSISNIGTTDQILLTFSADPGADPGGGAFVIGEIGFASVPEPTSMALVGLALGCGGFVRCRRNRKAASSDAEIAG